RPALRRDLVAGVRRQDLRNRMRILRILHTLDGEARLHRLVVALAHEERALEALVAGILPRVDDLFDVVGPALAITCASHSSPSYVSPSNMSGYTPCSSWKRLTKSLFFGVSTVNG